MASVIDGKVELVAGMNFRAEAGSGGLLMLDAAAEHGGSGQGMQPMEAVLLSLGGCTGMDVLSIIRKMRQDVTHYAVQVHGDRSEEHPRVFTHITVQHEVRGNTVREDAVRRAVELSATRYCPVMAMLGKSVHIEVRYRIIEETTGVETLGTVPTTV